MLTAASGDHQRGRGYVGTSSTKTCVSRRSVRRPVCFVEHGVQQLVGVQAALHQALAFAFADELHRFVRRGVDNVEAADIKPVVLATLAIFATMSSADLVQRSGFGFVFC